RTMAISVAASAVESIARSMAQTRFLAQRASGLPETTTPVSTPAEAFSNFLRFMRWCFPQGTGSVKENYDWGRCSPEDLRYKSELRIAAKRVRRRGRGEFQRDRW